MPIRRVCARATSCSCPGKGPLDPQTGKVVGDTIEEQTARVLENIKAILEADGASMADVVKVSAHLTDLSLFERYNRVYASYFPDPKTDSHDRRQPVAGHPGRDRRDRLRGHEVGFRIDPA